MKKVKIKFDTFQDRGQSCLNREATLILELLKKHYEVELSENPDYIFYDVNGKEYYKHDCVRIYCTIEALCPDFNLADYGIGFEKLEYLDRYCYFPNYQFHPEVMEKMVDARKSIEDTAADREFCSFVYSNSNADEMRGKLFEALTDYKRVDSGGRYKNNLPDGKPVEDKFTFEKGHKFSIACENASHPGYHTEKLAEAFAAGTIPIYWGDPEACKIFNPQAFINVTDYSSVEKVVERVRELDQSPEQYLAMLREPVLCENTLRGADYSSEKIKELEDFLVHIFDQPLEAAYRRNRGFWGNQYLDKVRKEGRVVERYMNLRESKPVKALRKVLGK